MLIFPYFKKIDFKILIPAILLTLFGLISLYGKPNSNNLFYFKRQFIFFIISFFFCILITFLNLQFLKSNFKLILFLYIIINILLFFVLIFGVEIRGTKTWYNFKFFSFDPIFFCQIILILLLANFFSSRHLNINQFSTILISAIYVFLPTFLVLLQPNLGSAFTLIIIWIGNLILSEMKLKYFLVLFLIGVILFSIGWFYFLKGYQKERILVFLGLKEDKYGISWNQKQSKIAIGSGKIFGKGIGNGSQTRYGFLPEAKTDFIFSAIAEETGFVGISILLFLYLFLFWQIIKISLEANYNFLKLSAGGFAFLLLGESFINIAMCLGLLPVIGIPLPFVSYGGSHLLSFYVGLGILMSLKNN